MSAPQLHRLFNLLRPRPTQADSSINLVPTETRDTGITSQVKAITLRLTPKDQEALKFAQEMLGIKSQAQLIRTAIRVLVTRIQADAKPR